MRLCAARACGLQVGQSLTIRNGDPLLHNVRAEPLISQPFDLGTPIQGMEVTRTFSTREVMVPFNCNVHAWMNAYVGVLEHPYFAVTDENGRFSIPQLPAGTLTLEIWHERLGTQSQQVTVAAKDTKEVAFTCRCPDHGTRSRTVARCRGTCRTNRSRIRCGGRAFASCGLCHAHPKPRLNSLVLVTTLATYFLGGGYELPWMQLAHTMIGTALVAAGASAFNQWWERDTDRLMRRTRLRPSPIAGSIPRTDCGLPSC